MITIIIKTITAIILSGIIHEFGHWLSAKIFKQNLKFKFHKGKFGIPRFIWEMPNIARWKQRIIAMSGFGIEFLFSILVLLSFIDFGIYLLVFTIIHFVTYKKYAGEISDFNWF